MDGTRDHILSEISEKEKEKYCDITYIWNLIHGTNEPCHRKENYGLGIQSFLIDFFF